jgi:hypothetical protein
MGDPVSVTMTFEGVIPEQYTPPPEMIAVGEGLIVTVTVKVAPGHPPTEGVTV